MTERLTPQCDRMILSANGDPLRFAQYGLPVLPDAMLEAAGPLAGVTSGLDYAASAGAESIVTAAADTPFFPQDLVAQLQMNANPEGLCIVASRDANEDVHLHPTFALWPVSMRHRLRDALEGSMRKLRRWTAENNTSVCVSSHAQFDSFFNINTPTDLLAAEAILA